MVNFMQKWERSKKGTRPVSEREYLGKHQPRLPCVFLYLHEDDRQPVFYAALGSWVYVAEDTRPHVPIGVLVALFAGITI